MERERDADDYEVQQERWEMADAELADSSDDPTAYADWSPAPGGRPDYGMFQLRYAATCHRCRKPIATGTQVFGRKFGDRWEIEHLGCTAGA